MSTSHPHDQKRSYQSTTNHCVDDRLSPREFELLLRGAISLDPGFALQCEFMLQICGRLGLRSGELAHITEEWIDFREQIIHIPKYEPCRKGRDGDVCGHCKQLARQKVEHNDGVKLEDALGKSWVPKTDAAARAVPYGFDPRAEIVIERFFDEHDEWPVSHNAVGRRLNRAANATDCVDANDVYPHCLRATAATFHAGRGLRAINLQALFGWADLSTARKYVRISGEAVANALDSVHA